MLAQAVTGTPGHVNSMAESVKHFIAHFGLESMKPGDAYITNDPWMGTGHLNDFVITTPCFHKGKLIGLFSCTSHLMDIGGIGFGPDGTDVFMEGLYIPFLKLLEKGKVNETLMAMIRANTRLPIDTVGDVYSLVACNDVGCPRLIEMMEEFKPRRPRRSRRPHLLQEPRGRAGRDRQAAEGLVVERMTIDGFDGPITLQRDRPPSATRASTSTTPAPARRRRAASTCRSPTPPPTPCSASAASSPAASPTTPARSAPLTVSAPEGCILNAAQARRRVHPPHHRPDAARRGVRLPRPGHPGSRARGGHLVPVEHHRARSVKGWQGGNYGFSMAITSNGGTGARPHADGLSATAYPSGVKGTPVEIAEAITPLIFWKKELRPGSGGQGRTRGGLGQIIEIESGIGEPFELLAAFDRIDFPPRGRHGGKAGRGGCRRHQGRQEARGQGHAVGAAGRASGGDDAGRRRPRSAGGARSGAGGEGPARGADVAGG